MKAKITVHIYAKTSKANKNGQLPIYFRLTVNGERFEFSTKKFIDKSKWSAEQSKLEAFFIEENDRTYLRIQFIHLDFVT